MNEETTSSALGRNRPCLCGGPACVCLCRRAHVVASHAPLISLLAGRCARPHCSLAGAAVLAYQATSHCTLRSLTRAGRRTGLPTTALARPRRRS